MYIYNNNNIPEIMIVKNEEINNDAAILLKEFAATLSHFILNTQN